MKVRIDTFHENPSSESRADACGQRHDEANGRFLHLCGHATKGVACMGFELDGCSYCKST
jgi:hypothetical protein